MSHAKTYKKIIVSSIIIGSIVICCLFVSLFTSVWADFFPKTAFLIACPFLYWVLIDICFPKFRSQFHIPLALALGLIIGGCVYHLNSGIHLTKKDPVESVRQCVVDFMKQNSDKCRFNVDNAVITSVVNDSVCYIVTVEDAMTHKLAGRGKRILGEFENKAVFHVAVTGRDNNCEVKEVYGFYPNSVPENLTLYQ